MAEALVKKIKDDQESVTPHPDVALFLDEWRGTREAGAVIRALADEGYERGPDGAWERCIFPLVSDVL